MNVAEVIRILQNLAMWLKQTGQDSILSPQERMPFQAAVNVAEHPAMYRTVTAQQGHDLALVALALFDLLAKKPKSGHYTYLPHKILLNLANGVPGSLVGLYQELLQRDLSFGEDSIFREADPATRDTIIALLTLGGKTVYSAPGLLSALSWIGDEVIQRQFQRWREDPPAWSTSMYRAPEWFTLCAGWELTSDGKRRDLYFQESYDVIPLPHAEAAGLDLPGPLAVATMQEERCGWCDRPLMTLFDLDLRDPRMAFLGLQGERLRIPICLNCSFQYSFQDEHVFMDVDWFGRACWSPLNGERPADLHVYEEGNVNYVPPFPPPSFVLGAARRTPYECAGAHLGGCPDWPQQDADYPRCPVCQQTMLFLGQHDLDQVGIFGFEGYLYAFVCLACQKATMVQQH
jgi:hypothetical protein